MTEDVALRLADGTLDPMRAAVAASLGSELALAAGVAPVVLPEHYRSRVEKVAKLLSLYQCRVFLFECAARALPAWEVRFPGDGRPREALEGARLAALQQRGCDLDLVALSDAAERARIDVDYPELTEDVDPELCRAMEAASACSHAAIALSPGQSSDRNELCEIVAWAARFGVKAAARPEDEREWQVKRLTEMLLE